MERRNRCAIDDSDGCSCAGATKATSTRSRACSTEPRRGCWRSRRTSCAKPMRPRTPCRRRSSRRSRARAATTASGRSTLAGRDPRQSVPPRPARRGATGRGRRPHARDTGASRGRRARTRARPRAARRARAHSRALRARPARGAARRAGPRDVAGASGRAPGSVRVELHRGLELLRRVLPPGSRSAVGSHSRRAGCPRSARRSRSQRAARRRSARRSREVWRFRWRGGALVSSKTITVGVAAAVLAGALLFYGDAPELVAPRRDDVGRERRRGRRRDAGTGRAAGASRRT